MKISLAVLTITISCFGIGCQSSSKATSPGAAFATSSPPTSAPSTAAAQAVVGSNPSVTTGILPDTLVSEVVNGTIREYPNVPIGKAFNATFDNLNWRSGESKKGVKFVEVTGRLAKDAFDKALAASNYNETLAVYNKCATWAVEVKKMPNYSFVKGIGDRSTSPVEGVHDERWRAGESWSAMMRMAEQNKGNEDRIAELFNTTAKSDLIDDFGKIGPGFPSFEKFVKKADITLCPPSPTAFTSVRFQFQFTPDGKMFSLTYVDMDSWRRIGMSPENVLKYVFD